MIDVAFLTLRELYRRRFVHAAVAVTLLLLAATSWGFWHLAHVHRAHGQPVTRMQILEMSSLVLILITYMFSFVLAVIGLFLGAPSVANDVESGVLLPVLARPLSRGAVITGKALALAVAVCAYTAAAAASEFAIVRALTGYAPPHPWQAVGFLCLLGVAMMVLALALSTRLSTIATSIAGLVLFALAWIGGIAGSLGDFYGNAAVGRAGILSQLLLPTDAMWRAAVYRLEPAAALTQFGPHSWPGPFFVLSPPPLATVLWTIGWIVVVYAIAVRSFSVRDL